MIWVEILSRHREVTARFRIAGEEVHIGRGYDNDVILDDPYVAAHHVRVFRDGDGRLVAEDAGSKNGMFADRGSVRQVRIAIDPEHPIRVGHTLVRIRETAFTVPPERAAGTRTQTWPAVTAAGLAVAVLGIQALSLWLTQTGEPRASTYLNSLLPVSAMVLCWVAVWTMLSRVVSGQARFAQNLVIALSGVLAIGLGIQAGQLLAFSFTWPAAVSYQYAVQSLIVALVCFFHLRELGRSRLGVKAAVMAALLALALTVQTVQQFETASDFGQQYLVGRLMPPALRLTPVRGENDFFADVERLKTGLDKDRTR
jgi:hypothetical protein